MARYKRILAAFDGSDAAVWALRQAVALARIEKSWIKVVSVVPDYEGEIELTGVRDIEGALRGPAEKLLSKARAVAEEEGSSVITNLEKGEPYDRIVDVAEAERCDLIIMGRRGRRSLEHTLIGCVTARVIGHTEKDVLVVPREKPFRLDNILFPTDGSKQSQAAGERALDLAAEHSSKLTVTTVVDVTDEFFSEAPGILEMLLKKSREALEEFQAKANARGIKPDIKLKEGDAPTAITDLAKEVGAGLIVMGSHGRKGIRKLLMGSVTEKVIGLSPCPVLVVRK